MAFLDNIELQVTCAALGYYDDGKYCKEPDCIESIKDLIRYLKRDNEDCSLRRGIGTSAIVQNDLIPLIKSYADDRILLETVVRLLVNLTQPARLCFLGNIPDDKERRLYYIEIENQLQEYKQAFADEQLFVKLTITLADLLKLDWEHRHEEDKLLIERILILLRNVLHIPKNTLREQRSDGDISLQDQILWVINKSGLEDLLIYIASSDSEKQFSMHVLEIISLMLREQSPELLASVGQNRTISEKEEDSRELENALEKEIVQKKLNSLKCSTRHSTFGGTFVVRNMKSISERELITHHPLTATQDSIDFDKDKKLRKKPKNRASMVAVDMVRRSALSIRTLLRIFCLKIVETAYNPLMKTIRDMLVRARAQENDETYFIWMMKFMMEFVRRDNFRPDLVCETLSSTAFHYISNQLEVYCECMENDKKQLLIWSKRMHLALKTYHELLNNLLVMDKSKDAKIRESSRVIKSNIFYTMEYREILLRLFRKFELSRQSKVFLTDLINANHLFLKLLEQFCKSNSNIVVENKKKFKIKKNKIKKPKEESLEDLWTRVSGNISAAIQGHGQTIEEIPFDAASLLSPDDQKKEAMKRIQNYLKTNMADNALSLFRACRDVWPDGEFGELCMSDEDEFMALREICLTDLGTDIENNNDFDEEEEHEELDNHYETIEQNFSFNDYLMRFANPQVIKPLILLLENFQNNTALTNHAIIKMLHRISFDCNLPCILFQMRLFNVFHMLSQDNLCQVKQYDEIKSFGKFILQKFFSLVQSNNKLYMELFFWKNNKEAIELSDGYGSFKANKGKKLWSDEQIEELKILYEECKESDEMDVIDGILSKMRDQTRTRRQVLRQLVMLDIIAGAKEIKKKKTNTERKWKDEEIEGLKNFYEDCKFEQDPISFLIERLSLKKSRGSIINKLFELGLISDKKEIRKKRTKKFKKGDGNAENDIRERETYYNDGNSESEDDKSSESDDNKNNSINNDDEEGNDDDDVNDSDNVIDDYEDYMRSRVSSIPKDKNVECKLLQIEKLCQTYLQNNGNKEMLFWLVRCFERTAEDKDEDEDNYAIPIVPLTEEQDESLSNKYFTQILNGCSLKKPANEQEKFWRIPITLNAEYLRNIANLLKHTSDTFTINKCGDNLSDNFEANINIIKDINESNIDEQNIIQSINGVDDVEQPNTSEKYGKGLKRKRLEELIKTKKSRFNKSNNDDKINNLSNSNKSKKNNVIVKRKQISSEDSDYASDYDRRIKKPQKYKKNILNDNDSDDHSNISTKLNKKKFSIDESDDEVPMSNYIKKINKRFVNDTSSDEEISGFNRENIEKNTLVSIESNNVLSLPNNKLIINDSNDVGTTYKNDSMFIETLNKNSINVTVCNYIDYKSNDEDDIPLSSLKKSNPIEDENDLIK